MHGDALTPRQLERMHRTRRGVLVIVFLLQGVHLFLSPSTALEEETINQNNAPVVAFGTLVDECDQCERISIYKLSQ